MIYRLINSEDGFTFRPSKIRADVLLLIVSVSNVISVVRDSVSISLIACKSAADSNICGDYVAAGTNLQRDKCTKTSAFTA